MNHRGKTTCSANAETPSKDSWIWNVESFEEQLREKWRHQKVDQVVNETENEEDRGPFALVWVLFSAVFGASSLFFCILSGINIYSAVFTIVMIQAVFFIVSLSIYVAIARL